MGDGTEIPEGLKRSLWKMNAEDLRAELAALKRLPHTIRALELAELKQQNATLAAGIRCVRALMEETTGVAALAGCRGTQCWATVRNGNWLEEFNEAEDALELGP